MSVQPVRGSARPRVSTIAKVRQLLVLFTPERPAWRLRDLADSLDWDLATTHRLANALVEIGLLERTGDGQSYQLGVFTLELSAVYLSANPRRRDVLLEMEALAAKTGLTAQLGVLIGHSVSIVESRESDSPLRAAALLGERLPVHASAAGKAILAQLDDARVMELVPERLETFTPNTIATRAELLEQLEAIRETGIARVEGELSEGLCAAAIAIPRGSYSAEPAALTCAGPPRSIVAEQWVLAETTLANVAARLESRR